ncbi:MAG: 2-amino-4-hydroxy-6-hydroxymethyldihydropteridine diphosphokinase [Gemmatimonadota bacterium]|nr:2-amino-4-hydroxy-6-hydroxymethyldihydropteridine diphosphokinase [Gemmatimonadota bacterium]
MIARAYVSLGSNVGDRVRWLALARRAVMERDSTRLVACSEVLETDPVDVADQARFLNQVLGVDTALEPGELLGACLEIERDLGRDRSAGPPRGPRTIDLDLLLYGGRAVDESGLTVPHPRLAERDFFLELCLRAGAPEAWLPEPEPTR